MPKYCRAPHCPNAAGQARPPARRLSFYKFPLQDAARLRRWLAQMRREDWVPGRHQHLCSDHFEPSCFQYRWGVRYLRPDAVPTIFPCAPPVSLPPPSPPPSQQSPWEHLEPIAPRTSRNGDSGLSLQKRESPGTPLGTPQPERPPPASGMEPVTPGRPPVTPEPKTPEPGLAAAAPLPGSLGPVEPGDSTEGLPAAVPLPPPPEPPRVAPMTAAVLSSALTLPVAPTVPRAAPPARLRELSTPELARVALGLQRKVKVLQQRHRRHRARLEAMEGLVEQLRRENLLSEERLRLACLQPGPVTPDPDGAVTIICREEEAALVYAVSPPAGTGCGLGLQQL
ncbi:THAP domain-containing protein 8 [Rhynochetos jubatus]